VIYNNRSPRRAQSAGDRRISFYGIYCKTRVEVLETVARHVYNTIVGMHALTTGTYHL
jgi:hypothetical protein